MLLDEIVDVCVIDIEHVIDRMDNSKCRVVEQSFMDEDEEYVLSDFLYNKEKYEGHSFF